MRDEEVERIRSGGSLQRALMSERNEPLLMSLSSKELRDLGESFQRWGTGAAAAGTLIQRANPAAGLAAQGAGGVAVVVGQHISHMADEKKAKEDADRKRAEEVLKQERARQQREAEMIRDYDGSRYDRLDRGETSRNDLGDRMDRFSRTA